MTICSTPDEPYRQSSNFEDRYISVRLSYLNDQVSPRQFAHFVANAEDLVVTRRHSYSLRQGVKLAVCLDQLPRWVHSSHFIVDEIASLIDEEIFRREL